MDTATEKKTYDDFLNAVTTAAATCSKYAETLIQTDDDEKRSSLCSTFYTEYAVLFITVGMREARKLRLPEHCLWQLTRTCFEFVAKKFEQHIFDRPHLPTPEPDREAALNQLRTVLLKKALDLDDIWKFFMDKEDAEKFIIFFGAVSKEVMTKCGRKEEWPALKHPLMNTVLEAWKSTVFVQVLSPLSTVQ